MNFAVGEGKVGEFAVPTRKGLILGAALVALYGLRQERNLEARHFGYADSNEHAGYALCKAAFDCLRRGETFATSDERILDLMAHTRQTLRVSFEEWDACVPIRRDCSALDSRRVA